jgi:hypothetical protein
MAIVTGGIDVAKNVFAVHGVEESGKPALVTACTLLQTTRILKTLEHAADVFVTLAVAIARRACETDLLR